MVDIMLEKDGYDKQILIDKLFIEEIYTQSQLGQEKRTICR
jgi:hypothetical protein